MQQPESKTSILVPCDDELSSVPQVKDDDELVDYESFPGRNNIGINVVHLSSNYHVILEDDIAHLEHYQVHKNDMCETIEEFDDLKKYKNKGLHWPIL